MPRIDLTQLVCDLSTAEVAMRKVGREEALGLLRDWEASGEPMSSWCARRGINWYSLSAFKGWSIRGGDISFAEVVPVEEPAAQRGQRSLRIQSLESACGGASVG